MPNFKLTFDVSTPTSEDKMYRIFETESENLARDEAQIMEWELCHVDAKVLFEKVEVIGSSSSHQQKQQ